MPADDADVSCPHGDWWSCIVDNCRPFVHGWRRVPGVIVPPKPPVACMWCAGDSERGQCGPCAALLEAIQAAPRAGILAIVEATKATWET